MDFEGHGGNFKSTMKHNARSLQTYFVQQAKEIYNIYPELLSLMQNTPMIIFHATWLITAKVNGEAAGN